MGTEGLGLGLKKLLRKVGEAEIEVEVEVGIGLVVQRVVVERWRELELELGLWRRWWSFVGPCQFVGNWKEGNLGVSLDFGLWFWGFYRGPEFGTILWSFIAFFVSDFFTLFFFLEKKIDFWFLSP